MKPMVIRSFGFVSADQIWDGKMNGTANAEEAAMKERREADAGCFVMLVNMPSSSNLAIFLSASLYLPT